jgi:predicted metal-dependent phosphoesterase TrpH
MYESLHNHTTASDGPVDYLELLRLAEENHYGVMALTDHDVLPSDEALAQLKDYQGPVKWLTGVEISSGLPQELGGGPASMFHILGLFVDPQNPALRNHCDKAVAARIERTERIVVNLRAIGFDITVEDCLADSGGESVGRRNIARVLARSPRYEAVMDRLRQQMADEAKEDPEVAMDYMRLLDGPSSDQPFKLFLSNDSFLSDIYVDYLYSIDMDESVRLIRQAGGIAVLAHWATIESEISKAMLEEMLAAGRLDGIELRSGFEDDEQDTIERELGEMADRTKAAKTYGVDGHTLREIEGFVRRPVADRTIGQTAALIQRFKPDLTSSNLG